MEQTTEIKKWQDEQALNRFQIISPLLDDTIDTKKRNELRCKIAQKEGISIRTLYRYEERYAKEAFNGLRPMNREQHRSPKLPENFDAILEQAVLLKREVPLRSVSQIIYILEGEGWTQPGVLKRSTLQRYLYKRGFGKKQMKKYSEAAYSSSKRFCKPHRMMLVQGDIKYGLELPIGKDGKKQMTYLSALIDDHSRMILASGWYPCQEAWIVEDTFHKAILQWGKMDAVYLDNGSQYISKHLKDAMARLGIRILHCKPYAAQSKGKIEAYNHFVDAFLREVRAAKIRTLEDLNHVWHLWVEEYYHNKPHEGLKEYYTSQGWDYPREGISPLQEWNCDSKRLTYLDVSAVAEAFRHHEKRLVDKGGCISLNGRKYEVSAALIGAKIEASYDPMNTDTITVSYPGMNPMDVKAMVMGSYCDPKPTIPASMLPVEPQTSRMLDVLENKHTDRVHLQANAISFSSFRKKSATRAEKDGEQNV